LNFPTQSQRSAHALGIQVQRRGQPEKYERMGEMLGVTDLADYLCSINEQCGFMEQIKAVASQV